MTTFEWMKFKQFCLFPCLRQGDDVYVESKSPLDERINDQNFLGVLFVLLNTNNMCDCLIFVLVYIHIFDGIR